MKFKAHVPTEEYGFIEVEADTFDEVMDGYRKTKIEFSDQEGLNQNEWARVRNHLYHQGVIEPEDYERLSKIQRHVINQMKLASRSSQRD